MSELNDYAKIRHDFNPKRAVGRREVCACGSAGQGAFCTSPPWTFVYLYTVRNSRYPKELQRRHVSPHACS
jgi:hypothetical protein